MQPMLPGHDAGLSADVARLAIAERAGIWAVECYRHRPAAAEMTFGDIEHGTGFLQQRLGLGVTAAMLQ